MSLKNNIKKNKRKLASLLSTIDQLIPVSILGVFTGLLTGAIIIAFRQSIERGQDWLLPGDSIENYAGLPFWARFLLPALGGLLIGILLQNISAATRRVGVVHVINALAEAHSHLPFRNALVQFVSATISIISGHSVGREGPGIHLGAACGSWLGHSLLLPHNTARTLVACGVAASIAASFNTPLAGVIFSMEVVLVEYTVLGFIPIVVAAVVATAVMRWVYGADPIFSIPSVLHDSGVDLLYLFFCGLVIGMLAAVFIALLRFFSKQLLNIPLWQRTTIAGVLTGCVGLFVPQVMGIGYESVNGAVMGNIGFGLLLIIVIAKLFATTAGLGLGFPGGLIGPTIVIGATAGAALGILGFGHTDTATTGFYALMGMGAMMGATLQAPLAALIAILELTANPIVIMPGMMIIVVACLTARQLFAKDSVYAMLLKQQGRDYHVDPVSQYLRSVAIKSILETRVERIPKTISYHQLTQLLQKSDPIWLLIEEKPGQFCGLVRCEALCRCLEGSEEDKDVTLLNESITVLTPTEIHSRASLQEALTALDATDADAVYVILPTETAIPIIKGVVTRDEIENY